MLSAYKVYKPGSCWSNVMRIMSWLMLLLVAAAPAAMADGLPDPPGAPEVPEATDALASVRDLWQENLATAKETRSEAQTTASEAVDGTLADARIQEALSTVGIAVQEVRRTSSQIPQTVPDTSNDLLAMLMDDGEPADEQATVEPAGAEAARIEVGAPVIVGAAAVIVVAVAWGLKAGAVTAASGATTTLAPTDLRRRPFAPAPLFTRFSKDTVLEHPKREELWTYIVSHPGACLPDLCDATGLSRTAVTHHLRLMEKQHLIVSMRHGRTRHFFQNGGRFGSHAKEAYAVLQNERSHEIAQCVASEPGLIQKKVCDALGMEASVAHWHLRRLQDAGLVDARRDGRTVRYFPGPDLLEIRSAAQAL